MKFPSYYQTPLQDLAATIDVSHRKLLFNILKIGNFSNVLEIGCLHGGATGVFLHALDEGAKFNLDLCDIKFTKTIYEMKDKCIYKNHVRMLEKKSIEVLSPKYDFIFLDGDHSLGTAKKELDHLLRYRTRAIVAHDTSVVGVKNDCRGARLIATVYKRHQNYKCLEDNIKRFGELTERGLFFATKDFDLYYKVLEINPYWR